VVGERWTLLIVRELLLGPRRYSDLLANLEGITTNLLAKRLKEMESAGILEKTVLPPPARTAAYALTTSGRELEPALLALGRWGWRFMDSPSKGDRIYLGWALIALKRRFRGVSSPVTAELASDDLRFQLRLTQDYVDIREGTPWIAEVAAEGSLPNMRDLFFNGASAAELASTGRLAVRGDLGAWKDFLRAFDLKA